MIYKTVVYLDLVIISNIIVNYLFIKATSIFLKTKLTFFRTFLSLLVSTISLFLFIVPLKYIYNLRYFIGILIGVIAFEKKANKLYGISILYLLNLGLIGTLVIFKVNNLLIVIISTIFLIILYSLEFIQKKIIKEEQLEYNVLIKGKKYRGFLDTGNFVKYLNTPIVFMNQKYQNEDYSCIGHVMVNTINSISQIDVYNGPSIYINGKEFIVFFSFVVIEQDIILNYYLEGIC